MEPKTASCLLNSLSRPTTTLTNHSAIHLFNFGYVRINADIALHDVLVVLDYKFNLLLLVLSPQIQSLWLLSQILDLLYILRILTNAREMTTCMCSHQRSRKDRLQRSLRSDMAQSSRSPFDQETASRP